MSANEVTAPKEHVKVSLENCKVCGITTQINARAVISNPAGKLRVSLLLPKLQTETRNSSQENPRYERVVLQN